MQFSLDSTDLAILSMLQRDASSPVAEIAKAVGLSQSPCWRRIQRLRDSGVISAQVTLLDRRALGFNLEVFVRVRFLREQPDSLKEFEAAIRAAPEVVDCYMLMGEVDFLLRVLARDVEDYERFLRGSLARLPGVRDITSNIALSTVKSTTALPLERAAAATMRRGEASDGR
jgi:Lrp/AsnC family transcriptional regulator